MEENEKVEAEQISQTQNFQEEKVKPKTTKKQAMDVAALTLGIISIVVSGMWLVALPTSILAIIFGVKSAKRTGSKIGKAGMITGIVGLSLCIVLTIGAIIFIKLMSY